MIAHTRVRSGLLGTMLIPMVSLQDQCAIAAYMDFHRDLSFHALVVEEQNDNTIDRFVMHIYAPLLWFYDALFLGGGGRAPPVTWLQLQTLTWKSMETTSTESQTPCPQTPVLPHCLHLKLVIHCSVETYSLLSRGFQAITCWVHVSRLYTVYMYSFHLGVSTWGYVLPSGFGRACENSARTGFEFLLVYLWVGAAESFGLAQPLLKVFTWKQPIVLWEDSGSCQGKSDKLPWKNWYSTLLLQDWGKL